MRNGSVLILVLLVVALLTLSSYTYFDLMFNERQASRYHGKSLQTVAFAESGVEFIKFFLTQAEQWKQEAGGHYDNPNELRGLLVADNARADARGRVAVIAPDSSQGVYRGLRFGLEDESARINLNTILLLDTAESGAAQAALMRLPGMTESIADAILDWLDPDNTPRTLGAETEFYSSLATPYTPQNGPLQTIEQLLLVRDVTPALLFGYDTNRNGLVDEHEQMGQPLPGNVPNQDGAMNRGWSAYFTINSAESNLNSQGQPKIDVNSDDLSALHDAIEAAIDREAANFIVAFRQGRVSTSESAGEPASGISLDFDAEARTKIRSLLDLIDVNVSLASENSNEPTTVASPFTSGRGEMGYLTDLMDKLTVVGGESLPGRININQAARVVLAGIPGLEPGDVEAILGARDEEVTPNRPERKFATWLLSDGVVDLAKMKSIMPWVTAGGHVYRAQFVGYYETEGPISRLEVIIDATRQPRVVDRRDLSDLGPGFSRAQLGVDTSGVIPGS